MGEVAPGIYKISDENTFLYGELKKKYLQKVNILIFYLG
jgi:hypothetical protein